MRIRIHEIETGSANLSAANSFYQALGLVPRLEDGNLTVFGSGMQGLDFNLADHLPQGTVQISLLTDDLKTLMQQLTQEQIAFEGPYESHLGMLAIRLQSPDGIPIVINTPTDSSPSWLIV